VVPEKKYQGDKVNIKSLRAIISRNRSHDVAAAGSVSPPQKGSQIKLRVKKSNLSQLSSVRSTQDGDEKVLKV